MAVKELLDWGADIDARDIHGKTPLMCAMSNGHTGVIGLLNEASIWSKS